MRQILLHSALDNAESLKTVPESAAIKRPHQPANTNLPTNSTKAAKLKLLERHQARSVSTMPSLWLGQHQQYLRWAPKTSRQHGYSAAAKCASSTRLGRRTLEDILLGAERKEQQLANNDFVIDGSSGILEVIDRSGTLGLSAMHVIEGWLQKKKTTPTLLLPKYNSRFVVLQKCALTWYRSDVQYYEGHPPSGSINFILQSCSIDFSGNNAFDIVINSCKKKFTFEISGKHPDKGMWMVNLLVHLNRACQIRRRFPKIEWDIIEQEVIHRHHLPWHSCKCNGHKYNNQNLSHRLDASNNNAIHDTPRLGINGFKRSRDLFERLRCPCRLMSKHIPRGHGPSSCYELDDDSALDFSQDINKFWKNSYRLSE